MSEEGVKITRASVSRIAAVCDWAEAQGARLKPATMGKPNRRGGDSRVSLVRPTGNCTGGGYYTGYTVLAPTSSIISTSMLTEAQIGVNGAACIIQNADESGLTTHDLTNGTPKVKTFLGIYRGIDTVTSLPVYMINGIDYDCEGA